MVRGEDQMTFASLMVRLTAGVSNDRLLQVAADAAVQFKASRVIGISACQPIRIYASPDGYVPAALIDEDFKQIEKELQSAERSFRGALEGKVTKLEWRSTTITYGSIADYVAEQMRAADLLITSAEGASVFDSDRKVNLADLVLRAGRPVLVAGPTASKLDLQSVILAWKDTREARRAAEDALPILELAERVTVVEVAAKDDLEDARTRTAEVVAWLANHGVSASACAVGAVDRDSADIDAIAKQLDAGLVIGGAYGHTRVREWVLGGVTHDLLLRPSHCSFVSH
jgi:nucleotide-binding universal stress UspA family protein